MKIRFYHRAERHFRRKSTWVGSVEKARPSYIVGESRKDYANIGMTHDPYKGKGKRNHLLKLNPDPKDKQKAYMRKSVEITPKRNFKGGVLSWFRRLHHDDEAFVDEQVEKKKAFLGRKAGKGHER